MGDALRNGRSVADVKVKFRIPALDSLDGNTVELDAERARFADDAIRYQSITQAIGHYMIG